jgi:hypothetical protein
VVTAPAGQPKEPTMFRHLLLSGFIAIGMSSCSVMIAAAPGVFASSVVQVAPAR